MMDKMREGPAWRKSLRALLLSPADILPQDEGRDQKERGAQREDARFCSSGAVSAALRRCCGPVKLMPTL